MKRRVVITGLGVVAPNGIGIGQFKESLISGKSGIKPIKGFDVSKYPTKYAGEIHDFEVEKFISVKVARRLDRYAQFGLACAKMALEDAGLDLVSTDKDRVGVLMGTAVGGQGWAFEQYDILKAQGYKRLNPFTAAATFPNAVSSAVSMEYGFTGISETISSGCASSSIAIGHAYDHVSNGSLDCAVCGGAEALIQEPIFASFCRARVLSEVVLSDGERGLPRPYDLEREGTLLGEGGAVLVLEPLEVAEARGARIYAELVGWHANCDAFHPIAHEPSGKAKGECITRAITKAGVSPEDIAFVQAHGVGDKDLDMIETKGYKLAFGKHVNEMKFSAIKAMLGHTQGACGAIELVAGVTTLQNNTVYPTINYRVPDPSCDLDYSVNKAVKVDKIKTGMAFTAGFGGKNVAIVIQVV